MTLDEPVTIEGHWDFDYTYYADATASRFFNELRINRRIVGTHCSGCDRVLVSARGFCDAEQLRTYQRHTRRLPMGSRQNAGASPADSRVVTDRRSPPQSSAVDLQSGRSRRRRCHAGRLTETDRTRPLSRLPTASYHRSLHDPAVERVDQ